MYHGIEHNLKRIKNHVKVPSFEAMLSPEQRRSLAIREIVPRDQTILGCH